MATIASEEQLQPWLLALIAGLMTNPSRPTRMPTRRPNGSRRPSEHPSEGTALLEEPDDQIAHREDADEPTIDDDEVAELLLTHHPGGLEDLAKATAGAGSSAGGYRLRARRSIT